MAVGSFTDSSHTQVAFAERWDGNGWGRVDYSFMRSGDVSYGPFGRQVFD